MTVLHTGSTKKFSANWGNIFSGDSAKAGKKAEPPKKAEPAKPAKQSKPKAAKATASKKVKPKK